MQIPFCSGGVIKSKRRTTMRSERKSDVVVSAAELLLTFLRFANTQIQNNNSVPFVFVVSKQAITIKAVKTKKFKKHFKCIRVRRSSRDREKVGIVCNVRSENRKP